MICPDCMGLMRIIAFITEGPIHPHLHAIVTDGLFRDTWTFYVMRQTDLKPLEDLFRAEIFKFLKKEGKITAELIQKLMAWHHSGFSIDNGVRIKREDTKGRVVRVHKENLERRSFNLSGMPVENEDTFVHL